MKRIRFGSQAEQGEVLHNDDTSMPVLALRSNPGGIGNDTGERTGVFTSGIVSTAQGHKVALFFTGRQHAGENLADVLRRRAAKLPPPIQMCDALSRNLPKLPKKLEVIVAHCLAHSRRRFVEVTPNFPEECRHVLEQLGQVYSNDARTREQGMSPEERLRFHQLHSGPVMDQLRAWLTAQFAEKNWNRTRGWEWRSVICSNTGNGLRFFCARWERLSTTTYVKEL